MIGRHVKIVWITLLLALSAAAARGQEPVVKATIDKDSILIGDHVTLSLEISLDKSHQFGFPMFKDTIFPGIELVEDLPMDTLRSEGGGVMLQKRYIITSFDSSQYYFAIPYLLQRGSLVDTFLSEPLSLYVNTIPIDTATYVMYDIKDVVRYPLTFKEILPWLLLGLGILLLILLAIYIYIRWKKKQPTFFKPKKVDPPYVVAMRELQKLKEEKVWQQNKIKQYYSRLTDILRVYIEDGYGIQAMEKTSQEILYDLEGSELSQKYPLIKLRDMFTVADLAKFAKYTPAPDENERAYITVIEFVEATKPLDGPGEVEKNEKADEEISAKEQQNQ
ncbi:MAG: hypothetical protein LBG19_11905 [Prevotellaceae bacterium]|jgi:hypothetical protein|nr:hypothetical protein [Prevotellaceae bacterium]